MMIFLLIVMLSMNNIQDPWFSASWRHTHANYTENSKGEKYPRPYFLFT